EVRAVDTGDTGQAHHAGSYSPNLPGSVLSCHVYAQGKGVVFDAQLHFPSGIASKGGQAQANLDTSDEHNGQELRRFVEGARLQFMSFLVEHPGLLHPRYKSKPDGEVPADPSRVTR